MIARVRGVDRGFDLAGIHLEGLGVRIHKNRKRAMLQHHVDSRDKRIRRNQDLIARLDAEGAEAGE